MQDIGQRLKAERIRQGKTIEDVIVLTRFSRTQIEAIENGNLDFFKDDLTYLKYYVQFYCKALKVEFNDFKNSLDDSMITYTNMLSEKEVNELRQINEDLQKKIKNNKDKKNPHKSKKKKLRLKLDFALFSFLAIVIVMFFGLTFVFGQYVFPPLFEPKPPKNPYVTDPIDVSDITSLTTSESLSSDSSSGSDVSKVQITKKDAKNYIVTNYDKDQIITISIEFNSRAWLDAYINNVRVTQPASNKIYGIGSKLDYVLEAKDGLVLELRLGYFNTNNFYMNNVEFELDSSVANLRGSSIIYIKFEGE